MVNGFITGSNKTKVTDVLVRLKNHTGDNMAVPEVEKNQVIEWIGTEDCSLDDLEKGKLLDALN